MPAYVAVEITIHDTAVYEKYKALAPDAERAKAWWGSSEYSPAKTIRQSCASTKMLLIDGPSFDPAKG